MHEALITKGMVRGHKDNLMINHACNCVLIHPACHKPGVGGEEIFRKCLKHLIAHEGLPNILLWIRSMEKYFPNVANDVKYRVASAAIDIGLQPFPIGARGALWQEK